MKSTNKIDWSQIPNFSRDSFPVEDINFVSPTLIYTLQDFRDILGDAIWPSPIEAGLVRQDDEGSMHYSNPPSQYSKAIDVFAKGNAFQNLMMAMNCQLWGGIGIYLDTEFQGKKWPMLHLDLRELGKGHSKKTALVWVRDWNSKYKYLQYENNPKYIAKVFKKLSKITM